ncbi:MAG: hypothetical protein DWP97_09470 [Calditrichaeota bacterium]|nr:MAG: hypothetical protein DWP97_09470 [Calditrichota bacterium]
MKLYTLKRKQIIPFDRNTVFSFFKSPENLEKITPSDVGFTIITPNPIKMQTGAVLDYTIKLAGIPVRWTTLITDYDEPHSFSDVSIKGPYSFWHHRHWFEETETGTIMYDEVTYALPFGFLGRIVHSLWVKKQLDNIFNFRAKIISDIFSSLSQKEQTVQQ